MGLQTVLGIRQAGFFVPHRHAGTAARHARSPMAALVPVFAAAEPAFADHLSRIDGLADDLRAIGGAPPPAPRFEQDWFPRLDAAALYALVRTGRPRRIVEVGSGHSTRFLMRALADEGLAAEVTAIDPAPRADVGALPLTLLQRPVQEVGTAPFAALSAGDLLMVDSSHVLMPGTDVDVVLNHVLPGAPAGLLVGFHDVFLPDPYPDAWPFSSYNEQCGIAPLLQGGWTPVFSSAWAVSRMADRLAAGVVSELPIAPGARESLLILKRLAPGPGDQNRK